MVAHFFITLRLPFPPDCTLNITENYPKVWWNCSKLFIKVCLCLNNKPISGVTEEAGFFPLFPVPLCDWGYWDYSASQYTHVFPGIWMFASCSHGHSLHFWFQGLPAELQTLFTLVMSEKTHTHTHRSVSETERKMLNIVSSHLFIWLYHLHIKRNNVQCKTSSFPENKDKIHFNRDVLLLFLELWAPSHTHMFTTNIYCVSLPLFSIGWHHGLKDILRSTELLELQGKIVFIDHQSANYFLD